MTTSITKAMILAAGKGERMRPLTDSCPKPLLKVNGKPLIDYTIEKLKQAGITELVVNVSHLGKMIEDYLGDGSRYGVSIQYSREEQPLETGGGIARAMPLLCRNGEDPFLLVNSDVWCDIDFSPLKKSLDNACLSHLVLVKNPSHNVTGDFALNEKKVELIVEGGKGFTYSGISIIAPELFKRYKPPQEKFPLRNLLVQAIALGQVSGEIHHGMWVDVGTPERLQSLR